MLFLMQSPVLYEGVRALAGKGVGIALEACMQMLLL